MIDLEQDLTIRPRDGGGFTLHASFALDKPMAEMVDGKITSLDLLLERNEEKEAFRYHLTQRHKELLRLLAETELQMTAAGIALTYL